MNKFKVFLVTILALTGFLAGYLLVKDNLRFDGLKTETGTILDKFTGQQPADTVQLSEDEIKPLLITDKKVVSPTNSLVKGSILYYEKNTGKVFEYDMINKTESAISDKILPNFISSTWSPAKKEVISAFYSPSGYVLEYYSFNNGRDVKFSSDVKSAAFSPDGNLIASYSLENNTSSDSINQLADKTGKLIISQPDGSLPKTIMNTRIRDLKLAWPAKDRIVLGTSDSGTFLLTEDGKLEKFLNPIAFLEENWSRSGEKMLYSGLIDSNASEPILRVKNIQLRDEKALNTAGSASKCAWSIDDVNIYCALAHSPSEDDIYLINTDNGSKKLVAELATPVKEMFLSTIEDYLLFISALDDKLYGLKISE